MERGHQNVLERPLDERQRYLDNAQTWLAEVLDGNMRTKFEYSFDGRELFAHDGGSIGKVFKDAVVHAENSDLSPYELRRRKHEYDEYQDMLAMMRGDSPNTMIVVSDFPPELMDATQDINGYNVARKQTMLRVITKNQNNTLTMYSQSLDKSDRIGLEALFVSLGTEAKDGELLGQRIHVHMEPNQQELLINHLTGVYDQVLRAQFGGNWEAGKQRKDQINTYDFVVQQNDLVGEFVRIQLDNPSAAERMRYGLAASIEQRFKAQFIPNGFVSVSDAVFHGYSPMMEMQVAGRDAAMERKVFSGCGASAGPENTSETAEDQLGANGYGDKDKKEDDALPSRIRCVNCKEKVPTKEVVKPKSWCCPKCSYEIDVCTGKILCSGNK